MVDSPAGVIPPDRMFELLRERGRSLFLLLTLSIRVWIIWTLHIFGFSPLPLDDRIHSLEASLNRLSEQLNGMRDEVYGLNKALYSKEPPIPINKLRPSQASPTSSGFPRAHLRSGSAQLVAELAGTAASPAASPLNSPVRTTHEALHSAANASERDTHHSNTGATGLSHSSSLRRRPNNYFGTTSAAHHNGLLTADGNSTEILPTSPTPATSPLPGTGSSSTQANSAEPPTPTAATYLQSAATAAAANHHDDSSEPQSAAMTSSNRQIEGGIRLDNLHSDKQVGTSSTLSSQRPATAQALSTSPGGTTLTLPNRPSTSALAESALSGLSNGLTTPASSSGTGTAHRSSATHSDKKSGSSSSSADNPYKSFRVTLEDPCYKVLPAALKKYKINDDWRQYALFICFGNQGTYPILLLSFAKDVLIFFRFCCFPRRQNDVFHMMRNHYYFSKG